MTTYEILTASTATDLEKQINDRTSKGWSKLDPMLHTIAIGGNDHSLERAEQYTQVMQRTTKSVNLYLSEEEARALLHCLVRTSAKGEQLELSEKVEQRIQDQLLTEEF